MSQNRPRNRLRKRRFYKRNGFWLGLFALMLAAGLVGFMLAHRYTRPYRARAASYDLTKINELEIPSIILDRNGSEIGRIYVQNRSIVPIGKVSQRFIEALCAGEDSRFFSHGGVDYLGIVRAVKLNLEDKRQGASTITQQLARNAYGLKEEAKRLGESTIDRKLVEMFLARRIEERYDKNEILGFYLNRIYFGSGFYGIRSAALGYFGKEPADLTIPECASLVTLIKNPTGRSPINNPEANRNGRNYVLGRMAAEKYISRKEAEELAQEPLVLNPRPLRRGTSHLYERVAEHVARVLPEEGLAAGGFKIHTTILAEAQDAAQRALLASLARAESQPGYDHPKYADHRKDPDQPPEADQPPETNQPPDTEKAPEYLQGAVLMIDHDTGEVLAHIGGRDYAQAPYDFVESGKRPLGTAFFPFLYAAGFDGSQTPATVVEDEAMDNRAVMVSGREGILGEWGMEVESPVYEGYITARRAFEQSKIAATVRFGGMVGLERIAQVGAAFGLPMEKAELLPRICVGWEEASMKQTVAAYAAIARGGRTSPTELVYVERIEDAGGHTRFRREHPGYEPLQVVGSTTAWQVHNMMAGGCEHGSARGAFENLLEKPFPGAAKGGSTHDFADAWFIGYNKRVTCAVWTGFLQAGVGPIYPGAFSRDLAMPVWQATMNAAAPSFGGGTFEVPVGVVQAEICAVTGQRATQFCQEMMEDRASGTLRSTSTAGTEYFRRGTEPMVYCTKHTGTTAEGSHDLAAGLPALSEIPIIPKAPPIVGDDPYHAEVPSSAAVSKASSNIRRSTNVLDSLDLGDSDEKIRLSPPGRLIIEED